MGVGTAGFSFPFTKGLGYARFASVSSNIILGATAPTNPGGTIAVPKNATYMVIAVEGQAFRWLDPDTISIVGAPDANNGLPLVAGQTNSFQCGFVGFQIAPQVNGGTVHVWYGQ